MKTGAHFEYEYMVNRLNALARSIKNVTPNFNAVLHLSLDILNEDLINKEEVKDQNDDPFALVAIKQFKKIKKFLIDPEKLIILKYKNDDK